MNSSVARKIQCSMSHMLQVSDEVRLYIHFKVFHIFIIKIIPVKNSICSISRNLIINAISLLNTTTWA